jgi:class 3 adenylate cyclase
LLFSVLFFCIILAGGSVAFLFAMRQIIRNDTFAQLSRIIETRNLQFTTAFDSQISLAVNMAESPLIRTHLKNPGDTEFERLAHSEFSAYRKSFSGNNIFWISDIDRRYYFNNKYSYTLDTSDPANSWYVPTLNQKDRFSFNVNFDIGIKRTLCWINVPVYDDNNIPIGIVGTGIDLTDYIDTLFTGLGEDVMLLLFNSLGEITGAKDISLMESKASISEVWESGRQVFFEAQSSKDGASKTLIINNSAYIVSHIPRLNWYIAVSRPMTILMFLNNAMYVFLALIIVILLIFIIFNIYISNVLKPINLILERMRDLSTEWKKSSRSLHIRQVGFVCFAFILMIAISFIFTSFILRNNLEREVQELLRTAELNIESNLREVSIMLIEHSNSIQQLIEYGLDQEGIRDYMFTSTARLIANKGTAYDFNGLYGYIRGEFLNGTNRERSVNHRVDHRADRIPEECQWFTAAKEKHGKIAETIPNVDAQTGEIVVSYSLELFSITGESLGVLSIDILLNPMCEYVKSLHLAETGYGILMNQNFEIMAYPDTAYKGRHLESISGDYAKIQASLTGGKSVTAINITNSENITHIAFFKQLNNGWYLGSLTPYHTFYFNVYIMAFVLVLIGSVLMITLILLISRQHRRIENYTEVSLQLTESSRRFVPTQFVRLLGVESITNLKLGDSIQSVITVMFFDIRFFSVHSQMLSIKETFNFVNKVFGLAGTIIKKHNGFVDKYMGDAAMVLFEHASDAVRAGIEIYRTVILNEATRVKNGIDGINIGIGVHTGNVMMGIIGDTEHYASTVISKHVNTASRIEGLTKQIKAGMLVSADAMQEITEKNLDFEFRYLGLVNPAGSREAIGISEILDVLPDDTRKRRLKTRKIFESAVRNFLTENYQTALERFKEVIDKDETDECARHYFEEASAHINGFEKASVFTFNSK